MKKRVGALVLSTMLTLTALTGCGGNKEASGNNTGAKDTAHKVVMAISGEQQPGQERVMAEVNKILKKDLNMELELMILPWGSTDQQIQLMLTGTEPLDLFRLGSGEAAGYISSGKIEDLGPLIDKYGKNIKEALGEEIAKSANINGFVYGVPTNIERDSTPSIEMRKDLVEKYDIDITQIKSLEDLEPIFNKVKAGEPNMTMLFGAGGVNQPATRYGGFDSLGGFGGVLANDGLESTKVEIRPATEQYKASLDIFHDWYKKGYINKDAPTSQDEPSVVMKAGNTFSTIVGWHPAYQNKEGNYDVVFAPLREHVLHSGSSGYVTLGIARNSKDPDKAMQLLDYIYGSPEVMNLLNWGMEGTDYVYIDKENNTIGYPEGVNDSNAEYHLNLGWQLPNQFIASVWEGSQPADVWDRMKEFNDKAPKSKAFGFMFDPKGYEAEITAISNVNEQYSRSLESGSVDPDEYLPKYVEALKKAGIEKVIAAQQKQLDEFLATKQP
ncbi:ABC transporter substrate-binding protein [Paenibacillus rubinfantis]|uniref:ABC transporter substrate-binding protein n=1 Tax=Paenibacillus rubinfantis TaxID=1720296 RepID=UPI0009E91F20|nr:ABC transporter substrate-binding protein [Paenibacillus rubinfantis]